jgi:DNA-binding PadR family transcriptional regulator
MPTELADLGRYSGPATLILSSLAGGPKHGYALAQDIEAFAGVRLQPGTLYGAISRLEHQGLIEALAGDGRRRPYRLSTHGAAVLQTHLQTQRQIANVGLRRLSAGWSLA